MKPTHQKAAPRAGTSAARASDPVTPTRGMVAVQIAASQVVGRVLGGKNLDRELAVMLKTNTTLTSNERQAVHSICFDTLRHYGLVNAQLDVLLSQPLTDTAVRHLLLIALAQLQFSKVAPHMVVDQAVDACVELGMGRAKGLANAVLRNYLRTPERFARERFKDPVARYDHPRWWITRLESEYPQHFADVFDSARLRPPMHLRTNTQKTSPDGYAALLAASNIASRISGPDCVTLEQPSPVAALPKFLEGWVSVQDAGAQLAARILDAKDGMRVLDACAAPGGKAAHILERSKVLLTALDNDKLRLKQVGENLKRLGLTATQLHVDAVNLASWWDGKAYDRVLLDVPCSGSGVTRRHPDIKWIRRETDIPRFSQVQLGLLNALWRCVAEGGRLLYVTCSVFQAENRGVVESFLSTAADAKEVTIGIDQTETVGNRWGDGPDVTLLPDEMHDGFYYALLEKTAPARNVARPH
jgi:16S rRNA (cytosine967-C5)-methyltransferase